MKKILLIATGGTIASKYTEQGLEPRISAQELLEYVPSAKEFCTIDTEAPFYDMTLEVAVTKMMWILAQTSEFETCRELFYTTINKDVLF